MPHDPLNSVASSAADIPAKLGQSSFTSECIPMAVTCGCAGLVLGVSVMLVVWYKCQRERDGLERRCKQLQKESETRKDKEKDNEARMVDMQQKQKSGLEETINQINNQLEKVKTDKEENKKTLQSVEEEIKEREKKFDKPEELLREKENLIKAQWKLDETKKNDERVKMKLEKMLETVEFQISSIITRRRDEENYYD